MYIEFKLPSGGNGWAAHHVRKTIDDYVEDWALKYNVQFRKKTVKYTHRIIFDNAKDYTLFGMSFWVDPDKKYHNWLNGWRFVEPMSIDKSK